MRNPLPDEIQIARYTFLGFVKVTSYGGPDDPYSLCVDDIALDVAERRVDLTRHVRARKALDRLVVTVTLA